jgi:PKD repeat protein
VKYISTIILLSFILITSCEPERDDDHQLGPSPTPPQFSAQLLPNDSNRVVITNLSNDNFQVLWDLPGGIPKTSSKSVDTILYTDIGEYTITLFVSKADGSGTASSSQKINILKEAPLECSTKLEMLTGCGTARKCWVFTTEPGAIKVGPAYGDFSWYTSPANGLQDAQYDDKYCFTFLHFLLKMIITVNPSIHGMVTQPKILIMASVNFNSPKEQAPMGATRLLFPMINSWAPGILIMSWM